MIIPEYTDHILSVVKGYVHSRIQDAMNNNNIGGVQMFTPAQS